MSLTHFDKEILPLNFFYMLRLGNMGKTQLMGVELLVYHLNYGLLKMCACLQERDSLAWDFVSENVQKSVITEQYINNNILRYVI